MMLSLNTYAQKIVGDMNGDGTLNISDVTLLVDKIMKGESQIEQEYVDLGLSVKWATANIGAVKPEDAGFRFAWGETESKESFTWSNYFDTKDGGKTFNICSNGVTTLEDIFDAASIASNGDCRMPTKEEWDELYAKCSITSKFISGIRCYKFTGPNGNFITIPYVSNMDGTSAGTIQFAYWSSSIDTSNPANAMLFNGTTCWSRPRYYGASVRGVRGEKKDVRITKLSLVEDYIGFKNPGESSEIHIYYSPVSANRTSVVWTSSDLSVAKVLNGKVTAVGVGKCTIIARTVEGDVKASCTVSVSTSLNGYDYVDLGTGVLWATMNVGADAPEKYGDHFSCAELKGLNSGKTNFTWETYSHRVVDEDGFVIFNEYFIDNRVKPEYDIAHVKWGGDWRYPTKEEQEKLIKECYWQWVESYNGRKAKGYIVYKAKTNADKGVHTYKDEPVLTISSYSLSDPHIFLPAGGSVENDQMEYEGFAGFYWSSMLVDTPFEAYSMFFTPTDIFNDNSNVFYGFSIRPVSSK